MADLQFFQFESDFIAALRCIPMIVRYKLDTCGIKLKLDQWHQFTEAERQQLVEMPCQTPDEIARYRQHLIDLILERSQMQASTLPVESNPGWLQARVIPDQVLQQGQAVGLTLTTDQWAALQPLQRFALIKLSRPGHENRNFIPALREFSLMPSD